jgi:hypothetical protein
VRLAFEEGEEIRFAAAQLGLERVVEESVGSADTQLSLDCTQFYTAADEQFQELRIVQLAWTFKSSSITGGYVVSRCVHSM